MQSNQLGLRQSLASVIAVFLIIGLAESVSINAAEGEIIVTNVARAAGFLLRTYVIYLCVGALSFVIARTAFYVFRRIRPFKDCDPLIAILSISIAIILSAYLFEYILQNVLGNPLTRKGILLLFMGAILLSWLLFSLVVKFTLESITGFKSAAVLLKWTTTYAFQGGIAVAYLATGLLMGMTSSGIATASGNLPNIWLISVDTLRQDRLSSYGYEKISTPGIDGLAADGVQFENAFSPDHWTLPAHASLFTSLSPDVHSVNDWASGGFVAAIPDALQTVAEQLARRGYTTIGAVDSDALGYLGALRNFDQGFRYYGHYPIVMSPHQHLLFPRVFNWLRRPVENEHTSSMISSIIDWLGDGPQSPYFFFLHLYDVHAEFDNRVQVPRYPYYPFQPCMDSRMPGWKDLGPPTLNGLQGEAYLNEVNRISNAPPFSIDRIDYQGPAEQEIALLSALYDCGVSLVDRQLGLLFDHLRDIGQYDNAIIILTSDHGEGFYEHREFGHWNLYDELLRVPLIIKPAGSRAGGRRLPEPVTLLDVAPTMLEFAGAPPFEMTEGQSLVPLISGTMPVNAGAGLWDRAMVSGSELAHKHSSFRYQSYKLIRGLFDGGYKLELYDVEKDPSESVELSGFRKQIFAEYNRMLDEQIQEQGRLAEIVKEKSGPQTDRAEFTDLMKDNLEALGYVE